MRSEGPWRSIRDKEISSLVSHRPVSWEVYTTGEKEWWKLADFSLSEKHQLGNQKALLSSESNLSEVLLLQKQNVKDNLQLQYFYFLFLNDKKVPLKRKEKSVNLQLRLFCSSAPALNRALCHLIMTEFYPVYFSPFASCPCVIACLTLEVGHPSY